MGIQKKLRRAENAKQKDYEKRKDDFLKKVKKLTEEYHIDIVPIIRPQDNGIFPLIAFVDVTEQYKKKEAEKKEKKKLEV